MGFDLNALATQTAVTNVEFLGQTASVMYNPSLLTQQNIHDAQQGDQEFISFFCDIVKDWDVKSGTRKVPISKKGLEIIPLPFLKAVFTSIVRGVEGNEEEGKASSGTSRPKARQAKSRSGSR